MGGSNIDNSDRVGWFRASARTDFRYFTSNSVLLLKPFLSVLILGCFGRYVPISRDPVAVSRGDYLNNVVTTLSEGVTDKAGMFGG